MTRTVAILGFHKIGTPPPGGWDSWFYVTTETFEHQLRYIERSGWHAISANEFLEGLCCPEQLPACSVLLTFDDGYRSMCDVTQPILQSFDMPAVLFVPTGFVGSTNLFDRDVEPEEQMCDWNDLRALRARGVSIQSHGISHRRFSVLDAAERRRELAQSKALLEARLGDPVELFSFPYGDVGGDRQTVTAELQRAGYRAAYRYGGGPVTIPGIDIFHIDRIPVGPTTELETVLGGSGI